MSDDLAAFWEARLAEDEAAAVAAAGADKRYGGRPHWSALGNIVIDASDPDWAVVDLGPCFEDASVGAHIVRHDPARTLRKVEAGRTVLAEYARALEKAPGNAPLINTLLRIIKAQAAADDDHPDYRQEWKP